mgnify:CR=1 FL=1
MSSSSLPHLPVFSVWQALSNSAIQVAKLAGVNWSKSSDSFESTHSLSLYRRQRWLNFLSRLTVAVRLIPKTRALRTAFSTVSLVHLAERWALPRVFHRSGKSIEANCTSRDEHSKRRVRSRHDLVFLSVSRSFPPATHPRLSMIFPLFLPPSSMDAFLFFFFLFF